jgi:hypothetical protein
MVIMTKYRQENENEWIRPQMRGYKMCCCDCGLVHEIVFKIEGKHIIFKVSRDNRATAAVRRGMNKKI